MITFNDFLKEQMQDEEFKAEYDALSQEFSEIQAMIDARKNEELTSKKTCKKQD